MFVNVEQRDDVVVVSLDGSLDAVTAPRVTECLDEQIAADRTRLAVDFGNVGYISSAGLRAILNALKKARQGGGDVRLANVQPDVRKVLDMSGFTSILTVHSDTNEAVASFAE